MSHVADFIAAPLAPAVQAPRNARALGLIRSDAAAALGLPAHKTTPELPHHGGGVQAANFGAGNWGATPNAIFTDRRLSSDAKAVAGWLCGRPEGWKIVAAYTIKELGISPRRWQNATNCLIRAGYMRRFQYPDPGQRGRWCWHVDFDRYGGYSDDQAAPEPEPHVEAAPEPLEAPEPQAEAAPLEVPEPQSEADSEADLDVSGDGPSIDTSPTDTPPERPVPAAFSSALWNRLQASCSKSSEDPDAVAAEMADQIRLGAIRNVGGYLNKLVTLHERGEFVRAKSAAPPQPQRPAAQKIWTGTASMPADDRSEGEGDQASEEALTAARRGDRAAALEALDRVPQGMRRLMLARITSILES